MVLRNGISVLANGNLVTFSKVVRGKILKINKNCPTIEKCLFWANMYGGMDDDEWVNTVILD